MKTEKSKQKSKSPVGSVDSFLDKNMQDILNDLDTQNGRQLSFNFFGTIVIVILFILLTSTLIHLIVIGG